MATPSTPLPAGPRLSVIARQHDEKIIGEFLNFTYATRASARLKKLIEKKEILQAELCKSELKWLQAASRLASRKITCMHYLASFLKYYLICLCHRVDRCFQKVFKCYAYACETMALREALIRDCQSDDKLKARFKKLTDKLDNHRAYMAENNESFRKVLSTPNEFSNRNRKYGFINALTRPIEPFFAHINNLPPTKPHLVLSPERLKDHDMTGTWADYRFISFTVLDNESKHRSKQIYIESRADNNCHWIEGEIKGAKSLGIYHAGPLIDKDGVVNLKLYTQLSTLFNTGSLTVNKSDGTTKEYTLYTATLRKSSTPL